MTVDYINWYLDAQGNHRLLPTPKEYNYPIPSLVFLDTVYGYDDQYTGTLSPSGEAPPVPSLAITKDELQLTVVISGSDSVSTNYLIVLYPGGDRWTEKGTTTGDGTISVTLTAGTFWVAVKSQTVGGCSATNPYRITMLGGEVRVEHSPAQIFAKMLQDFEWFSDPMLERDWPVFISSLPEFAKPLAVVYDTAPIKDGRLSNGENIFHYGIQLRIRCMTHQEGWDKLQTVCAEMEVQQTEVELDGVIYIINNVSQSSSVLPLGTGGDAKRRYEFTVNFMVSLTKKGD
jgi:hypothetical protein